MVNMKMDNCDCVILCGGLGTRLQSVVSDVPKVMAQVNGRPFLDLIIEYLKSQGIRRIILCTGYKADFIEDYYRKNNFGLTIDFSRENEPLGTGGALKNAREIIKSDPFLVLNGDSFLAADLKAFFDFHKEKGSLASMLIAQVNKAEEFGSLELDENCEITKFFEKSDGSVNALVNAGIYCFDQTIFSNMPESTKFSLEKDLFPELTGKKFYGYRIEKRFFDIGTPERYQSAKQDLK